MRRCRTASCKPPEEVDAAAEAAASAYPHYRQLPASRRAEFLDTIAAELDALDDDFVAIVCRETALPATRIQGERSRTSGQLRLFAEVLRRGDFHGARIDRARPERKPLPRVDLRQCRIGLGPVAVFGASNFPWRSPPPAAIPPRPGRRLPGGVQGAQRTHGHRRTGRRGDPPRGRAHRHAGGRVQHDLRRRSRERLVRHPAIQAVGFTGSLKGGRALCDMAAARAQPIPVFAEMSSINPVVPAALKKRGEAVADELSASVVLGCGQFCTNPGLVIGIRSAQFSAFLERFAARMDDQPAQTMLNAGTLASYEKAWRRCTPTRASAISPGNRRRAARPGRNCSRRTSACCWRATSCCRKKSSARPAWSSRSPTTPN